MALHLVSALLTSPPSSPPQILHLTFQPQDLAGFQLSPEGQELESFQVQLIISKYQLSAHFARPDHCSHSLVPRNLLAAHVAHAPE